MIFMMAVEQEYDELNMAIKMFQYDDACALFINSSSSCSSRNDFGGGCEMSLHADKVVAAAETYMGLVNLVLVLFQVVVVLKNGVKCL
jgi:3-hydroxyacyl-CoA dehydrogenase